MGDKDSIHNKPEEEQLATPRQSGKEQEHERYVMALLNFLQGLEIPFYQRAAPRYPNEPEWERPKLGEYKITERLGMVITKIGVLNRDNASLMSAYKTAVTDLEQHEAMVADLSLALELLTDLLIDARAKKTEKGTSNAVLDAIGMALSVLRPEFPGAPDANGVQHREFDVRLELLRAGFSQLKHDFAPGERLCRACRGLSVVKAGAPFGLSAGKEPKPGESWWPYEHEWVSPCGNCYMGKVSFCKHCDADVPRNRQRCDCKVATAEHMAELSAKREEAWAKLPRILLSDYKEDMLWAEHAGKYLEVDQIEEHLEEAPGELFFACTPIADLGTPEASDVIDRLQEQAYDEAQPEDSGSVLDFTSDAEDKLQVLLDAWAKENVIPRKMFMADMTTIVEVNRGE